MFKRRLRHKRLSQELCEQRNQFYRLAYSWCGDSMLADDLVQDALQKALTSFDSLKDDGKVKAWYCRILLNGYRDWLRRRKETLDIDELELADASNPQQALTSEDTSRHVRRCIKMLGHKHREVITLVDLMEFSYEEVSLALEIPIGTVMSRLCRGRAQLKELQENRSSADSLTSISTLRRVK